MPYAKNARFSPEKGCLPGTREEAIKQITEWADSCDENAPPIFLLTGVAGSGKSAIAHAVARHFQDREGPARLGSSFCFVRSELATRYPENFFSTITRDLAALDPRRRKYLVDLINRDPSLKTTRSVVTQFEQFFIGCGKDLGKGEPTIVIVIDALDESGDHPSQRKQLLDIFAKRGHDIPPNFRFLVTSRREIDIEKLIGKRHIFHLQMDDISSTSTERDIALFIKAELVDAEDIPEDTNWQLQLVEKSEGLFQWAVTACRFIQGNEKIGLPPSEQLKLILSTSKHQRQSSSLDDLYKEILQRVVDTEDDDSLCRFQITMGMILAAAEPLSISSLDRLHCKEDLHISQVVAQLHSLLSGDLVQPHFVTSSPIKTVAELFTLTFQWHITPLS